MPTYRSVRKALYAAFAGKSGHSNETLRKAGRRACRHCGGAISRNSRGTCRACSQIAAQRAMPADFIKTLNRLGSAGAAKHYRASCSTVTRWREESEIERGKRIIRRRHKPCASTPIYTAPVRRHIGSGDYSTAAQAADYLRRWSSVYRCDQDGRCAANGGYWRRMNTVLTNDQLVARAKRLGFVEVE